MPRAKAVPVSVAHGAVAVAAPVHHHHLGHLGHSQQYPAHAQSGVLHQLGHMVGSPLQLPGMGDHGMVVHADMTDMMHVYQHADMGDIALAQPVKRVKSRSKKATASRNGTRCKECGCAICMKDRQSVAKSAGATQKPCPASPRAKQAWIDANDGKIPNRPSRSKVTQCVQCGDECWKTVPLQMKKGKSKKLGGLAKSALSRSSRRCKECGCAVCEGKSPQKECEANEEQKAQWLQANGGRALSRPSRSKIMTCVRCTDKCWEHAANNSLGQRRRSQGTKKTMQRTRKNRRCKACGCANCDGRSTGACSATPAQRTAWVRANGNKSLSRPARSKVETCTRCKSNCWSQGEGGAPLKLVAKKNRGRNYRSKMRCKTCGCAECVARRPPKDPHCDAPEEIQKDWRRLNGNKLPARPSRSKAKSCLRCQKNCWRIGPEARKKVGEAPGQRKTRRSVRRCKVCGCAECGGRSSGICNATSDEQRRWKDANGGKELIRPARSKVEQCTRCAKKCWTKKPTPKRKRGRRSTVVTRNHRRCKQCGCANCDGKTSGVCTGTSSDHKAWVDANDTITLTRPSRSKVTRCTRCHDACWVNDGTSRKRLRGQKNIVAEI